MISNWKEDSALLLLAVILSLAWAVNHYGDNAITFKKQRDKVTHNLKRRTSLLAT